MGRHVRVAMLALILAAASAAALAQEPATVLLRSGSRVSGALVDMGGSDFTMTVGGAERRIAIGDVAVIDFGGDAANLPRAEASRASEGQHVLVLRDGRTVLGRLEDIGGTVPLRISFGSASGTTDYRSTDVRRIYLTVPPAASLAAAPEEPEAPSGPEPAGGKTVEVSPKVLWTRTGVTVRQGQVIQFTTRGRVRLSDNPDDMSGPAGREGRQAAGAPLPNELAGALIGRIGTGRPFGIGDQTSITAPATGELFLGVNDDHLADNSGAFRVTIVAPAAPTRRR